MKTNSRILVAVAIVGAVAFTSTVTHAADPLPSWNDTAPKQAIIAFVEKVTREGSPDFVPPAERIAIFDNDGCLWAEQPMYFQAIFIFDRIKTLAPAASGVEGQGTLRLGAQGRREGRARRR